MELQQYNNIVPTSLPSVALKTKFKLPKEPGIYFVIWMEQILYIGRSENIFKRWQGHHRYQQILEDHPGSHIAWIVCSEMSLLPVIENALIDKFQPPINWSDVQKYTPRQRYREGRKPFRGEAKKRRNVILTEKNYQGLQAIAEALGKPSRSEAIEYLAEEKYKELQALRKSQLPPTHNAA